MPILNNKYPYEGIFLEEDFCITTLDKALQGIWVTGCEPISFIVNTAAKWDIFLIVPQLVEIFMYFVCTNTVHMIRYR